MSEENKGWKDRHFFSLNLSPAMKTDDNPSTLPNLETNPARYESPEEAEKETEPEVKAPSFETKEPEPNPEDEANAPKAPYPQAPSPS